MLGTFIVITAINIHGFFSFPLKSDLTSLSPDVILILRYGPLPWPLPNLFCFLQLLLSVLLPCPVLPVVPDPLQVGSLGKTFVFSISF